MKIKLRWDSFNPKHAKLTLFMGYDADHLTNIGQLCMTYQEAFCLRQTIREGISERGCDGIFEAGWTTGENTDATR